jgi:drug/metabolite transporter (DMT)-like permease
MGLINNVVPFTLIAYGQKELGAGLASVLNATTPLFTVIVAHLLTQDERMTPAKLAGVVLGVFGVAVLTGIDRLGLGAHLQAELACLGATLSYAFSNIFGRRFRRMDIDPMRATFGQVTASACLLLVPALLVDRPWTLPPPGPAALACVAALGILSTAVAYQLFYRVLASAGATAVSLVTLMIPPTAILLGALVLGERLEPRQFAGAALIGLGLLVVDGRLAALLRRRAGRVS